MSHRLSLLVVGLLAAGLATAAPAVAAAPTVRAVSPGSGPINTAVTITGTGFVSPATVKIGGVLATSVVVASATRITARVPQTGRGAVVVTNARGTATGPVFTVTPGLLLRSPVVRPGGSTIVTAAGFTAREAVDVQLDTVATGLTVSSAAGTLSPTVTAPRTILPGPHTITLLGRKSGAVAQATLTVRTDWAASSFDARHTGVNPYENVVTASTVDDLGQKWRTSFGFPVYAAPAVAGGVVYLHGIYDDVIAVDAATGSLKWRKDLSDRSTGFSSPVVSGGSVYVGGADGYMYALNASTGAQRWRYNAGAEIRASPTVSGSTVYFSTLSGALYALDTANGTVRWGTSIGGTEGYFFFAPTVVGGFVYVGASNDTLRRLDAANGGTGWVVNVGGAPFAAPVVADGRVFAGLLAGEVVALNASSGTRSWSATVGNGSVVGTPVLYGGRLIVSNTAQVVTAYDYTSGEMLWTQSGATKAGSSQVSAAGGVAYVSGISSTFAYDPRTGTILRRLGLSSNSSGVVVSDGALYDYDYNDQALVRYDTTGPDEADGSSSTTARRSVARHRLSRAR